MFLTQASTHSAVIKPVSAQQIAVIKTSLESCTLMQEQATKNAGKLIPLIGQPIKKARYAVHAKIINARHSKNIRFSLINKAGTIIKHLPMALIKEKSQMAKNQYEFAGVLVVPDVAFNIAITSENINGKTYQDFNNQAFFEPIDGEKKISWLESTHLQWLEKKSLQYKAALIPLFAH